MNKQLINKFKPKFDHWLSGGELLFKWTKDTGNVECWVQEGLVVTNNLWNHGVEDILHVIINDEYLPYRKALAEGKTIQSTGSSDVGGWFDLGTAIHPSIFEYNFAKYRVKPDEPIFKVGDWVQLKDGHTPWAITKTNLLQDTENLELWQPQEGDWCWFWDFTNETPVLGRYINFEGRHAAQKNQYTGLIPYDNVAPFIGALPTNLKDKHEQKNR